MTAPCPARAGRGPGGPRPGGRPGTTGTVLSAGPHTVRARFALTELPVITVCPEDAGAACAAVGRALRAAGRGQLGGRLELRTGGPAPRTARQAAAVEAVERRVAALAVASALRGGSGTASLRVRPAD
ncbi:hypothetical protein ACIRQY_03345 [Streptomyces sp. NPDC101490]|uniref:hypothetical protein n=1 Tax=Streptomyces sp. NPDC101490 TaxID=3366143 RepID=UPI00382FD47B